jgi:subtilisin family serine protease
MNRKLRPVAILTVALLVASSMTGIPLGRHYSTTVHAAPKKKKTSPDLDDHVKKEPGNSLRCILTTPGRPSQSLSNAVKGAGGDVVKGYAHSNVLCVQLPAGKVNAIANRPDVSYACIDRGVKVTGHLETTTGADQARNYGPVTTGIPGPGPGPVPVTTGLVDGSGIGIAILDSGVNFQHHSFLDAAGTCRVVSSIDFTGENRVDDAYGHGTHVAAMAAASNHVSAGAYTGIAPGASIFNVRVLDSTGAGSASNVIAGIDWCISNKNLTTPPIRVLNLSLGAPAVDSYADDPVCHAVRNAVNAGLIVCVAAGNMGKNANGNQVYGGIHSPGIEPSAITVGAVNTFGTDARSDDGITTYSSRGPTRGYWTDATTGTRYYDNLIKPDLSAPGNKMIEAESAGCLLVTEYPSFDEGVTTVTEHLQMRLNGTSMATPAVAGAVALMLQVNPALTPNMAKAILEYTAQPLAGFNTLQQGAGELNVEGAVRLASLISPNLATLRLGDPLLVGPAPTQSTTIAGETFVWGAGLVERWDIIYGPNLINTYQNIYGTSVLMTDGVLLAGGVMVGDSTLLTEGVLHNDGVLMSDGTLLASGVLMCDGSLLANSVILTDGTVMADNCPVVSDSVLSSTAACATAAQSALRSGDAGAAMSPVQDHSVW